MRTNRGKNDKQLCPCCAEKQLGLFDLEDLEAKSEENKEEESKTSDATVLPSIYEEK